LSRERLAVCTKAAAGKTWVLARNANTAVFPKEGPGLAFLDSIAGDKPLFVDAVHAGFASTAAMQIAGVGQTTQAPAGGVIVRDGQGQPIGTFRETAKRLIEQHVPQPTEAEFTSDFESVAASLPSYGIVSVQEITGRRPPEFFQAARDQGKLPVRVRFGKVLTPQTLPPTEAAVAALAAPAQMYRDRWFRAGVIKIYVDGDLGDQTAALFRSYVGSASAGEPLWQPQLLNQWAAALDAAGLQLYFHAVGDRAVRMSLDAIQHAQAQNGRLDARHQITHLHLVSDADLPRFAQLGVIANIQPSFATNISWNTDRALELIGPKRHATMFRFRDMLAAGAELAGGTDTPVVTADQLVTVETAVTRQEPGMPGKPFLPKQRLTRAEAIKLATLSAAKANFLDQESGSITVGKWADFVMLDKNIMNVPAREIHRVRILWTVIEGHDAYVAEQDMPSKLRPSD
jgi:predicted amidohydrolase YtcJ